MSAPLFRPTSKDGPTLNGQLLRLIAAAFALALFGVFVGQWLSTRAFVQAQLSSHAQDAATSLALALTQSLQTGDTARALTTVLPVFDRGYYRRVAVRDTAGRIIVERTMAADESVEVPLWFAHLASLQAPQAQAKVTAGWQQLGHVEVESHPRFAYQQLWRSSLQSMGWLLLLWGAVWWLARRWLATLLAPLKEVESVAQAAVQRRLEKVRSVPTALELKRFVAGFNHLVDVMQRQLTEEEDRAERFRLESLQDPLTGMLNRQGLRQQLDAQPDAAWLGFVECRGIEAINQAHGFAAGDALIRQCAQRIQTVLPNAHHARLRAAGFAIYQVDREGVLGEHGQLREHSSALIHYVDALSDALECAVAWVRLPALCAPAQALAAADLTLQQARARATRIAIVEGDAVATDEPVGAQAWASLLTDAASSGRIVLRAQSVFQSAQSVSSNVLHREIFASILGPDDKEIGAARWWPMAQRLGLLAQIDRAVIDSLAGRALPTAIAINLSAQTWADPLCSHQLSAWQALLGNGGMVFFELRESEAIAHRAAANAFAEAARLHGFAIGIDRFGIAAGGIALLRELLPSYVKLDASLSAEVDKEAGRFHIEALARVARTLDIPVLAQSFGDQDAIHELARLGVQGVQAYALSNPEAL